ncbi:MAG: YebC/PmpR family DNA-binding transcriptional regulator [Candidatus Nomurabacteria bacterium]|nr:YebC/PmpR family DNA-binding transcriptional regulator [Candidatus Nomurabacteria bacterium]
MSGHSKWATTHRQKAVVDAKRGAIFTRLGNLIAIAARGGADPAMNPSLAMVVEKAKQANMPNENIKRAIARASDKNSAELMEDVYEAYAPGGVGVIIETATDNRNRTMPEIKTTLAKNGGRLAEPGSVLFQFERQGVIEVSGADFDNVFLAASEIDGVLDVVAEDDLVIVYTDAKKLMAVRSSLLDGGLTIDNAELQYVPKNMVELDTDVREKVEKLLNAIDDLDDVTSVHTNADL